MLACMHAMWCDVMWYMYMSQCVCTFGFIGVHVCDVVRYMYGCMRVCMYACDASMHPRKQICMHVTHACMNACLYACMSACTYACICACSVVCLWLCMRVFKHMCL